ncbi:MAG: hypothetical protein ACLUE1_08940 [Adlercreutzia equolifaciens]
MPVELPQEFLDKFPGGMLRYRAEEAGTIDQVSSGLVRLFGCFDAEQFRAPTATRLGHAHPDDWEGQRVGHRADRAQRQRLRALPHHPRRRRGALGGRLGPFGGRRRWHPLVLRNNHGRD